MESINRLPKIIQVEMGDSKTASKGILYTEGLAACVGLALRDPLPPRGFLAHILDPLSGEKKVQAHIRKFVMASPDVSRIEAYLRGGAPTFNEDENSLAALYSCDIVVDWLLQNGIGKSQISARWISNPNYDTDMRLNVTTGAFSSKIYRTL